MAQSNAQPVATTEHVPASEHGRGFPPFDPQHFASQLVWLALVFVALYVLMSRIALPRVASILEERGRRISGDLAEAERLKGESDAVLAAHEKALNEARAHAQTLANETRQKASRDAEARRKEVDAGLNLKVAEAEKSIAATRSRAMTNVRGIAGEAAGAIVERLTGTAPASAEVMQAVDGVLKR
jgi:F-type H+-transporting ATPase subunit b